MFILTKAWVGTAMGTAETLVPVCVAVQCQSISLSLHSLPQHRRMNQTWKLGQPQIKQIAESSGKTGEETEVHRRESRGTSF